ncbi:IS3 family transposase [Orrella marina]|uniref:IS3 family transposase n=1 Tax=Orrella marina TaxID=2163011 RepID=A0A2R4XFL8_9BURK|nr:IS3 family transposase [Orrella marina]AWB32595.1 IS3 family transposase [Orrella marina]
MARYGQAFKDKAVARLLPPESASLETVSREMSISVQTLERWRAQALTMPARERAWSAAARFEAVLVTAAMDEAGKNAWCREKGIYPQDLDQWRQTATQSLADPQDQASASGQRSKADHKRIRELERDLDRKDKALAETAALLVLFKKAHGDLSKGQGRGRMIALKDRQTLVQHIDTAHQQGARLDRACSLAGLTIRTLQRWKRDQDKLTVGDRRPLAARPTPAHAFTPQERQRILDVVNESRFADCPPARIVPMLADEDVYIGSEATISRVLRQHGQTTHRGRTRPPQPSRRPTTHVATGPGQVYCWDMTYLPTHVQGQWFYLYLIQDIYSRKIIGWEIHEKDDSTHAVALLKRTALAEGVHAMLEKPVMHGDNGSTLKATSVLAMLNWLGIEPSYSRPRVSDDNAFAESLFKTAKYRPEFPARGFKSLEAARQWGATFVHWYNHEHRHSGIQYVTPDQRHRGEDIKILGARHALYQQQKRNNPARWSGQTRNWSLVGAVTLNPEREEAVKAEIQTKDKKRFVA